MILAIDPSFSGTGIALSDDKGSIILTRKVSCPHSCYQIVNNHLACKFILSEIKSLLLQYNATNVHVIIEYPALSTRSGAYLAILNGYLSSVLSSLSIVSEITWIPPTACDSFINNKKHSKTFIVNWCREHKLIISRVSHDECTAIVFVYLYLSIISGKYKNSYFVEHV